MRGHRRETGLTLLELIVAAAVVALLAALAVPAALAVLRASREGRAAANLRSVATAEMTLYDSKRRFGVFDELLRDGDLARQFRRGRGRATEALSDGVYLYSIRFTRDALGVTLDADPDRDYAATYRRFRLRLGRVASGPSGGEGVLLVAPPSVESPPPSAYKPYNSGDSTPDR
jgi:type II secretory pathway pseudopilin PulG